MPEGDTVRIVADTITERFAGRRVERSVFRDPRLAGRDLAGRALLDAGAYGKHLFIRFEDGRSLHAHLGMDGSFVFDRPSPLPEWKRRVELWFGPGSLVGESVPVLELMSTAEEHIVTDALGPDLCATVGAPDPGDVAERLRFEPDRPVAGAMLDQRLVAGFGNVYANEVPFIVGVDPFQPIGAIDGLDRLVMIGTALIRTNARLRRQNTVGRRLRTDATWVHGRGRRPCPVCGETLRYRAERATPWQRSITWCAWCQAEVERAAVDVERARRLIALHPATRDPLFPG